VGWEDGAADRHAVTRLKGWLKDSFECLAVSPDAVASAPGRPVSESGTLRQVDGGPGRPRDERFPPEVVDVALYEAGWPCQVVMCLSSVCLGSASSRSMGPGLGSREVPSALYSRSSRARGTRRRMRGFEGWGRHLRSGPAAAAKSTFALTHPSNLRETMRLTTPSSSFSMPPRQAGGQRASSHLSPPG